MIDLLDKLIATMAQPVSKQCSFRRDHPEWMICFCGCPECDPHGFMQTMSLLHIPDEPNKEISP